MKTTTNATQNITREIGTPPRRYAKEKSGVECLNIPYIPSVTIPRKLPAKKEIAAVTTARANDLKNVFTGLKEPAMVGFGRY